MISPFSISEFLIKDTIVQLLNGLLYRNQKKSITTFAPPSSAGLTSMFSLRLNSCKASWSLGYYVLYPAQLVWPLQASPSQNPSHTSHLCCLRGCEEHVMIRWWILCRPFHLEEKKKHLVHTILHWTDLIQIGGYRCKSLKLKFLLQQNTSWTVSSERQKTLQLTFLAPEQMLSHWYWSLTSNE